MSDSTPSLKVVAHGDREIVITRTFAAPRTSVFEAMVRADLLRRWLSGPPGWTMVECESDPRPGGRFRHAWSGPEGARLAMFGTYEEVEAPRRIVRTESFDVGCGPQAGEQLATLTLHEAGDGARTELRIAVRYPDRAARDAALASGMEHGMSASYARLDGELAEGHPA